MAKIVAPPRAQFSLSIPYHLRELVGSDAARYRTTISAMVASILAAHYKTTIEPPARTVKKAGAR